jgi:predicted Rossmann fold flavoprotein
MNDAMQTREKSPSENVLVVGGGPAGLMAAIAAAKAGARVAVLERLAMPGTKLVATGGGRCNLTNTLSTAEFLERFGKSGKFMRPAIEGLDSPALRSFFQSLGINTRSTDGLHYFPVSESATEVRDALLERCRALDVEMFMEEDAFGLIIQENSVRGVETSQGRLEATRVVLAAGGCAWPALGSNGSGFTLAQAAGHSIVRPCPALVPLVTRQDWPRVCTGIVIPGARIRIELPKAPRTGVTGDLLFTHRGISGPIVLDLSAEVSRHLAETGIPVPIRLYLTPESNPEIWNARISAWRTEHPRRLFRNFVSAQLPHTLAETVCAETGIDAELRAADLTRVVQRRLADWLAGVTVEILRTEGFDKAMVTSGGVTLREVEPRTLQSRLVKGLYFAGEILDIAGPCGGYNLQWAFSSGHLAGQSAARTTTE